MDHFIVLTRPNGDHFVSWCPDLPGWTATGATEEDAGALAHEITAALVAARRQMGVRVAPSVRGRTVPAPTQAKAEGTFGDAFGDTFGDPFGPPVVGDGGASLLRGH